MYAILAYVKEDLRKELELRTMSLALMQVSPKPPKGINMTSTATKDARIVARVSQETQDVIRNAAELSGATISQFVVEAVVTKAHTVINEMQRLELTLENANRVFQALENPPEPNAKVMAAAKRYKEKFRASDSGDKQTT